MIHKTIKGYTIKDLKGFCLYLIENYVKINPKYEDSRIYIQLKQFYEEGRVKDIIYKNTKLDIKNEWLETTACQINGFYKIHKLYSRRIKIEKIKENI